MSLRESRPRPGSHRPVIAIAVITAVILAALGSAVLSQEVKDQKPKKPRFEKTELTLKDNKTGLVWPLNANLAERKFSWSRTFDALDRIVNTPKASVRRWMWGCPFRGSAAWPRPG